MVCGRYVVGFGDSPPFAPLSFAEDLLFYETILIMVGDGALDVPFYNDISKIINFKFVGADSFVRLFLCKSNFHLHLTREVAFSLENDGGRDI